LQNVLQNNISITAADLTIMASASRESSAASGPTGTKTPYTTGCTAQHFHTSFIDLNSLKYVSIVSPWSEALCDESWIAP
jgi:hypothetical protein